ncbi:type 1 fimbria pilin [Sinobacterium caligoides]|uniref:Type 1 fimbria pilin n=1 Tax=Sinobacterium caligoides TaxID=933926 RepID=A0A3N2DMP0_9GAMM|nr:fimbrial protein [Sinobacterium caligoides]ROS01073.1 type 1 fimbria pilin [Sinobacterium caligoides]
MKSVKSRCLMTLGSAAFVLVAGGAQAQSHVTFQGEITQDSCTVNINNETSHIVKFDAVSNKEIMDEHYSPQKITLPVTLTDCEGVSQAPTLTFNGTSTTNGDLESGLTDVFIKFKQGDTEKDYTVNEPSDELESYTDGWKKDFKVELHAEEGGAPQVGTFENTVATLTVNYKD